jgi:Fe-S-cluster containining protein
MTSNADMKSCREIAKRKAKENEAFYAFLKGTDVPDEQIDSMVQDLYRQYAIKIDCKTCRNCCKQSGPQLTPADVARLARKKGTSAKRLIETYLEPTDEPGTYKVRSIPCPFLEMSECAFGDEKPDCCRDYPFLLKEKFTYRLIGVFSNYEICPIVFNVVETLKHLIWNR